MALMIKDNLSFSGKTEWLINVIEYAEDPDNPKLPSDQSTSCLLYHCILLLLLLLLLLTDKWYQWKQIIIISPLIEIFK